MNNSAPVTDLKQQALIEDAARWRLIGILFECPVEGWLEMLTSLASSVPDPELKEAAETARSEAAEGLYHSILGPGGSASPREVSYLRRAELGGLMSELAGYYDAFGYQPAGLEPNDHVAVEAGFVGYLRMKEAYAEACGDLERSEVTADAARHFIEDHLAAIAEPLEKRLKATGIRYLAIAGEALLHSLDQSRKQA
jgi:hypothetical protein